MERLRNPKKVVSRIGLALFLFMLVWVGGMALIMGISSVVAPRWDWTASIWSTWLLNDIPLYLMGVPVFLLILRTIPNKTEPEPARPGMKMNVGRYLLAVVFSFGAMYAVNYATTMLLALLEAITGHSMQPAAITELVSANSLLPNFIFGVVVPAFGEEFVFRYMLRRKLRGSGDKIYILVSAVCFGAFHGNFNQMFYAAALGAIFAWLYVRTNKLWIPISLHFIVNLVGIVLMPMLIENIDLNALDTDPNYIMQHLNKVWPIIAVGAGVILVIIGAIIIFAVFYKRVRLGLAPPTEPGWPYKPPKEMRGYGWQGAAYEQAPYGGYNGAYGQPAGYCWQGGYPPPYQQPPAAYGAPYGTAMYPSPGGYPQSPGQPGSYPAAGVTTAPQQVAGNSAQDVYTHSGQDGPAYAPATMGAPTGSPSPVTNGQIVPPVVPQVGEAGRPEAGRVQEPTGYTAPMWQTPNQPTAQAGPLSAVDEALPQSEGGISLTKETAAQAAPELHPQGAAQEGSWPGAAPQPQTAAPEVPPIQQPGQWGYQQQPPHAPYTYGAQYYQQPAPQYGWQAPGYYPPAYGAPGTPPYWQQPYYAPPVKEKRFVAFALLNPGMIVYLVTTLVMAVLPLISM